VDVWDPFHILLKEMIEADMQQDEEKFLKLTHLVSDNNIVMKNLRRGKGIVGKENRLVVRSFYEEVFDQIVEVIKEEEIYRIIVTGTPGVGKSTSRNYLA
jgi:signal recognition particle GTPase